MDSSGIIVILIIFMILFILLNVFFMYIPMHKIEKKFDFVSSSVDKASGDVEGIVTEIQQSKRDVCEWIQELHIPPPSFCK